METGSQEDFWGYLELLVKTHRLVIDRPKGSRHPRFPEMIYPLDYGYLEGTLAEDQGGIDVWVGQSSNEDAQDVEVKITGLALTVDLAKGDVEIKILLNCSKTEIKTTLFFHNSDKMAATFIQNPNKR